MRAKGVIILLWIVAAGVQDVWSMPGHCSKGCDVCPQHATPVCSIIPSMRQFPCLCALRKTLCKREYENVVFYRSPCFLSADHNLGNPMLPLYTFQADRIFTLRKPKKSQPVANPFYTLTGYNGTPESTSLKSTENGQHPIEETRSFLSRGSLEKEINAILSKTIHGEKRIKKPGFNQQQMCEMFYREDPNFKLLYKGKHFQCPTANPKLTEVIPK